MLSVLVSGIDQDASFTILHSQSASGVTRLCAAILIHRLHGPVWVFSFLEVLGVYFPLAIGKLESSFSVQANPLDRAVSKDTLLRPTSVQILDRLVRKYDLFSAVRVVLLDLIAWELEDLKTVWVGGVSCLGISVIVNQPLIWHHLFHVTIEESHYDGLSICADFLSGTIRKSYDS